MVQIYVKLNCRQYFSIILIALVGGPLVLFVLVVVACLVLYSSIETKKLELMLVLVAVPCLVLYSSIKKSY